MFVLHKSGNRFRGVFVCDICDKPINTIDEAKAIIAGDGSRFFPRSQVHTSCIDEDSICSQDTIMTLKDYVEAMIQNY